MTIVSNLYDDDTVQLESMHWLRSQTVPKQLNSGSDCWTRTSDPVINSPRVIGDSAGVCGPFAALCPMVYGGELFGLARAAAALGADWETLEATAAGLGHGVDNDMRRPAQ